MVFLHQWVFSPFHLHILSPPKKKIPNFDPSLIWQYLKGFTGFSTAYETAKEIEAHFVNDPFVSDELKKLKKVALRNNIALKTIAAFNTSDTREISLELVDHSHFASIFVKRGNWSSVLILMFRDFFALI